MLKAVSYTASVGCGTLGYLPILQNGISETDEWQVHKNTKAGLVWF